MRYFLARLWCSTLNVLSGYPRFNKDNDITDHLPTLFFECNAAAPKLIVELGTRGGVSTQTLIACAKRHDAVMVSVDIDDCSHVAEYEKWTFVHSDDLKFAKEFPAWCRLKRLERKIDFLLVDTSHTYEQTVREIAAWFPYLAGRCRVAFHDTNLSYVYRMRNGRRVAGQSIHRAVIRAIEEYLGIRIAEHRAAVLYKDKWRVTHDPHCSGMTVLERLG
jgi:cephalosporin hydroxylase